MTARQFVTFSFKVRRCAKGKELETRRKNCCQFKTRKKSTKSYTFNYLLVVTVKKHAQRSIVNAIYCYEVAIRMNFYYVRKN